ncbi:peptidoglycan hydrolase-like protein with peptidoglycan-binding domain [Clostridium acetobutylicum]|uniref:Spore cortex-lytic enzyme, pre-pro-form (Diverged form of N-acetylmuramyl-L-alanine amidase) peptidoglycan-binding domain n=1 Tax=Clostridium acetobutylicum (strain ATCC 824 / DSM 792 / JCM 1419 / IAM 19013 / LMG 5710 / NBRC 13948 / NRRL B-527 / VKM B-1787 / 2291 / W) TaxID=272562 RepID=Q97E72_CLOAB|nr:MULTISPECIES: peptidoglycan-binding domain-containing protein [Clostridium]AAK81178.1 Spore cortex-lytic enzyme, pre-pro-form (diverged form of N-acetylmuramyl-L-alanine amidase); peptidoglycan-binding domain [Clostridium acetobutylicum ATCC 824]ADZ22284.1 Spore cortex-lytic enzyme, pre-pro-form (diverged form of N-acetylmuramyl-L-alanine amidase) [Clostridium acetobutylicum EA 2018]AEI32727.1 spore cortex-lytic protein [Clostridium acetobutylicum DSM 1731]AWV81152.1 peptidoglycan-binding pr
MAKGRLQVQVFRGDNYTPVSKSKVTITPTTGTSTKNIELNTDSSGLTQEIELDTPPIEYSMRPTDQIPYGLYDIRIDAANLNSQLIKGCQVMPDRVALQNANLTGTAQRQQIIIEIQPNVQVGKYPPKIPEAPEKPAPSGPSGFVVLPEPEVPQYIVVHAGPPDSSAPNYTVRFIDYIKNVCSSEIFSTWSDSTIRANALCIISFVLNRVYTEWYRGKGKDFTITNSTAFDQAFSFGRNIYKNISNIVDDIFTTYIKLPGRKQPLLTQFCDGKNVQCPGWLTQWGSKYLGDQGKTAPQIIRSFYGSEVQFATAQKVQGIPMSYPGYALRVGSTGIPVRTIQTYLNRISNNYSAIPKVAVTSTFGTETRNSVQAFQRIFNIPVTGVVDYGTWYRISDIYVAVTKIAELRGEDFEEEGIFYPPIAYPDRPVPYIDYPQL